MVKVKKKMKEICDDAAKYKRQKELARERQRRFKANMTEEQLEKKRSRDRERRKRLREEKIIKPIAEMKAADQKKTRQLWKKYSATYRKKQKDLENAVRNTPPPSDNEDIDDPEPVVSRQKKRGRKEVRRNRSKTNRTIAKQAEEIENLKRTVEKYKKRLHRQKIKSKEMCSPSPNKKVKELVATQRVSPKIKKKLFAAFALEKQIKHQVKAVSPKTKDRQLMCKVLGSKILKKYRAQACFKELIPYTFNKVQGKSDGGKPDLTYTRKRYTTVKIKELQTLRKFFEDDSVSRMCPGKRDYIKKGKSKVQRRILLDTLRNLYTRFTEENPNLNISYTTFTRSRPFWVTRPNNRDRETCACVHHENFQFLVNALKSAKVIKESNTSDVLKSSVCSVKNEKCMKKLCKNCRLKGVNFCDYEDEEIKYYKWEKITEEKIIKGAVKKIKRVVKSEKVALISEVIHLFKKSLPSFKNHVHAMIHQLSVLKRLKKNLKEGELVFQVDFSQNYIAKYATEIQSMHFGASKRQVSLHTGVRYHHEEGKTVPETFCTASSNLDHHCHGVWAHLRPILEESCEKFPMTHTVHFFSDSPSSQYRNRGNIHLMSKLLPKFFPNLKCFTWNFSEPGHGKGPMDGVGGAIKRSADQLVNHGADIKSASELVELLKDKSMVKLIEVTEAEVEEYKKLMPSNIPVQKGIMQVRQLCFGEGNTTARKLSCFDCAPSKKCKHYHFMNIDINSTAPSSTPPSTAARNTVAPSSSNLKKRKLTVQEVYSSSDDEGFEQGVQSSVKCTALQHTDIESSLKQGAYVIVSLDSGKQKRKKMNFVGVLQTDIDDEDEVTIMFMKAYANDPSTFMVDEKDVSYVSVSRIVGVLPAPTIISKGSRLFYKFKGPVEL